MLSNHLAVQRNAFSTAANGARVPDGKAQCSVGQRLATSQTIFSNEGEIKILFVPSINVAYIWQRKFIETGLLGGTEDKYRTDICPHTDHLYEHESNVGHGFPGHQDMTSDDVNVTDHDNLLTGADYDKRELYKTQVWHHVKKNPNLPEKFRLVSAGMRVSCINNSENNNGYFEAVRVNVDYDSLRQLMFYPFKDIKQFGVTPDPSEIWSSSHRWVNDPTYVTGKLRDIYKHNFHLKPVSEREFTSAGDNQEWTVDKATHDNSGNNAWYGFPRSHGGIDRNFDCIAIAIHAAPLDDTSPHVAAATALTCHVHTVHNYEQVFHPRSTLARFMTNNLSYPRISDETDRLIKRDQKASNIRSASNIPYNVRR
jgi:hypothetical protein